MPPASVCVVAEGGGICCTVVSHSPAASPSWFLEFQQRRLYINLLASTYKSINIIPPSTTLPGEVEASVDQVCWAQVWPVSFVCPSWVTSNKYKPHDSWKLTLLTIFLGLMKSIVVNSLLTDDQLVCSHCGKAPTLIKKNQIFLISKEVQKEQLQSHIWLTASSYMGKY